MDPEKPSVGFTPDLKIDRPEEILRREKALLQELVESVLDGILIVSPEGRLLYYNEKFLQIWRIPAEIAQARSDEAALKWAAQQTAEPEEFVRGVAAVYADPQHDPIHGEVLMRDGRILDRFGTAVRRNDMHYGWLWTFRDITARKKAEEDLRQSEQELLRLSQALEKRVEERTHALQEQRTALQDQRQKLRALAAQLVSAENRERKRLASLLHDDLQQLLAAARMRLASVGQRIDDVQDRAEIELAGEWVEKATSAARELTHELRPPALYEDGLVPALHWLASRMRKRHRLKVTIDNPPELPRMKDDWNALLFDCVRELLFNIVKYARVEEAKVSVVNDPPWLRIVVEDQGAGFDSDFKNTASSEGGFGLFSIRERLVGLGGKVRIDSTIGTGTRIELALPIAAAVKDHWRAEVTGSPVARRGGSSGDGPPQSARGSDRIRVLVVDDHALVRQGIANIMRSDDRLLVAGEAADGVEAIEAIERTHPDVVVMDVNMPRLNGIEATREIRRRWPGISVVGLSVQDDPVTEKSVISAGACAFLPKSGNANRMIQIVSGIKKAA